MKLIQYFYDFGEKLQSLAKLQDVIGSAESEFE
jgi:hypothetical protein